MTPEKLRERLADAGVDAREYIRVIRNVRDEEGHSGEGPRRP